MKSFEMLLDYFTTDKEFPFFIQYGGHNEDLGQHTHKNFTELSIVLDGSVEHIVDDETYTIKKGDVFVISNDTAHGFENPNNFRLCNIMFPPSFFKGDFDIKNSPGFQALFVLEPELSRKSHFCSQLHLSVNDFLAVTEMLDEMLDEYESKREGYRSAFKADFLKLCITLSRLYSFDNIPERDSALNIAKAMAYIESNFTENITVSYLAKLSNYSERQFIRVFKETYNCRCTDYITRLRIKKARGLLKNSDISVSQVAVQSGFDDINYFSRVFKKYRGMTPTEYRKSKT